jgi:hypothetical protein
MLVASVDPGFPVEFDQEVWATFDQEHLHLFDAATEQALPRAESRLVTGAAAASTRG